METEQVSDSNVVVPVKTGDDEDKKKKQQEEKEKADQAKREAEEKAARERAEQAERERAAREKAEQEEAEKAACLNIKGNISSSGEKIFHLPGGDFYDITEPEDTFCSEAAARAAGYRESKR